MVSTRQRIWQWLRIVATAVLCCIILAAAGVAVVIINRTEPTAEQVAATRKSAALVETITVKRGTYRPQISILGSVTAAQDIRLSPRVSGQVIQMSPAFAPGMTVAEGELLFEIDPADFQNTVQIRKSELEQSKASLKIEQGRGDLAEKELELLEGTIAETNRDLVLRVPQIESIEAEVKAAEAGVEQAKLDLERTKVYAPFRAQIIDRNVNLGSQVAPGDELARLVGVNEYWILASVPVRSLRWIEFPEGDRRSGEGSIATLRNPGAWPPGASRQGYVSRMIGTLDQQTRLARVLITVPDPLATEAEGPPLILDTLVETQIQGRPFEDVVRLSRDYIRERDTVWVMQDGKLEIREPEILFQDAEFAYISEGLDDGDEVVTTTLATVANGIGLRKMSSPSEAEARSENDGASASSVRKPSNGSSAAASRDEFERKERETEAAAQVLEEGTSSAGGEDDSASHHSASHQEMPVTPETPWDARQGPAVPSASQCSHAHAEHVAQASQLDKRCSPGRWSAT